MDRVMVLDKIALLPIVVHSLSFPEVRLNCSATRLSITGPTTATVWDRVLLRALYAKKNASSGLSSLVIV